MTHTDDRLEAVLRRDRAITGGGILVLTVLAWIQLLRIGREMASMAAMGMAHMEPWTLDDGVLAAAMWVTMMVAMMLPTAAPMMLVFTTWRRRERRHQASRAPCEP